MRDGKTEIEYEVYCDGEFAASTNSESEAWRYVEDYRSDGPVLVYEVTKTYSLIG